MGYVFDGIDDLQMILFKCLLEVFNNTRIYENNGFYFEELFKRSERRNPIPFRRRFLFAIKTIR